MTPTDKIKRKNEAEIRSMEIMSIRAKAREAEAAETDDEEKPEEESYIVEGYAARYEPYVLFTDDDGNEWTETFTKANFEEADKTDIILQYDHQGRVYARTSNETLAVEVDDKGLHIVADLGKTEGARALYEDIAAGMITKMSWRFSVDPDAYIYDTKKHDISYKSIKKIYDCSAVSIPANSNTEIATNARSFVNGVIAEEKARSEARAEIEKAKTEILEILKGVKTNENV